MDTGEETIQDKSLAVALRKKAAAVHKRALLVAAAITVVVMVFPE
jgi:uncharacterized membrane protein YozB (DUF420 family)